MSGNQEFTFYGTFGHGQPHYPGYFEVTVFAQTKQQAEVWARERMSKATNNRYCSFYDSLDKVHELDRIYRG